MCAGAPGQSRLMVWAMPGRDDRLTRLRVKVLPPAVRVVGSPERTATIGCCSAVRNSLRRAPVSTHVKQVVDLGRGVTGALPEPDVPDFVPVHHPSRALVLMSRSVTPAAPSDSPFGELGLGPAAQDARIPDTIGKARRAPCAHRLKPTGCPPGDLRHPSALRGIMWVIERS